MAKRIYTRETFVRKNRYVDLTNDLTFSYYFSTNRAVLLSFIRSFLPTAVEILDVQIIDQEKTHEAGKIILLDTVIPPIAPSKKRVILDLLVLLSNGEVVHLEMQKYKQQFWQERITFCWSLVHGRKFEKGACYEELKPTYTLFFTTVNVFGSEFQGFIHPQAIISENKPHKLFTQTLRIIPVELGKVPKSCGGARDF